MPPKQAVRPQIKVVLNLFNDYMQLVFKPVLTREEFTNVAEMRQRLIGAIKTHLRPEICLSYALFYLMHSSSPIPESMQAIGYLIIVLGSSKKIPVADQPFVDYIMQALMHLHCSLRSTLDKNSSPETAVTALDDLVNLRRLIEKMTENTEHLDAFTKRNMYYERLMLTHLPWLAVGKSVPPKLAANLSNRRGFDDLYQKLRSNADFKEADARSNRLFELQLDCAYQLVQYHSIQARNITDGTHPLVVQYMNTAQPLLTWESFHFLYTCFQDAAFIRTQHTVRTYSSSYNVFNNTLNLYVMLLKNFSQVLLKRITDNAEANTPTKMSDLELAIDIDHLKIAFYLKFKPTIHGSCLPDTCQQFYNFYTLTLFERIVKMRSNQPDTLPEIPADLLDEKSARSSSKINTPSPLAPAYDEPEEDNEAELTYKQPAEENPKSLLHEIISLITTHPKQFPLAETKAKELLEEAKTTNTDTAFMNAYNALADVYYQWGLSTPTRDEMKVARFKLAGHYYSTCRQHMDTLLTREHNASLAISRTFVAEQIAFCHANTEVAAPLKPPVVKMPVEDVKPRVAIPPLNLSNLSNAPMTTAVIGKFFDKKEDTAPALYETIRALPASNEEKREALDKQIQSLESLVAMLKQQRQALDKVNVTSLLTPLEIANNPPRP